MWIQELWRYPVKSMAGERLESAEVTEAGIVGDRMVLVAGPGGRIITSRTHPRLLGLRGSLAPDGEPLVNSKPWGAFEQLGVDHRRLRPNIVIGGVDGLAERGWPGRRLRVGGVIASVASLRSRCVMTTYDPDTQEQDLSVLRRIASEFGGQMALDCGVLGGGRIAVGDPVELLEPEEA